MLYFIPAWYYNDLRRENEQVWYQLKEHTEFDDTVKQIQLFDRNEICDFKLLLFSFTPNLRHFLHRQGIFSVPYWSVFDSIQGITRKKVQVFSYRDLKWPKDTTFIYTPFCIIAEVNKQKHSEIFFGKDGNLIEVHFFGADTITRKNYYDDRGFLSSTIVFKNGKPYYEQYLNENGTWKICHFFDDNHVEINPSSNFYILDGETFKYSCLHYSSLDEVIFEVFNNYYFKEIRNDIFCIAMHKLNDILVETVLRKEKRIISLYQNRYFIKDTSLLESVNYTIIDSRKYLIDIYENKSIMDKLIELSPFDTRFDFGKSSQLGVQNILLPVDELDAVTYEMLVINLIKHLYKNDKAVIHVFTRKSDFNRIEYLTHLTNKIFTEISANNIGDLNYIEDEVLNSLKSRVVYDQCIDEMSVRNIIREQRILVDFSDYPDLYLQILCLSSGIPQIVRKKTQYIEHKQNGVIIDNFSEIDAALSYYLSHLYNWNQAKVYSYDLLKNFTAEKLVEKWIKIIKKVEND